MIILINQEKDFSLPQETVAVNREIQQIRAQPALTEPQPNNPKFSEQLRCANIPPFSK